MPKLYKLLILLLVCIFTTACGKEPSQSAKNTNIAIVDVDKAMSGHALYAEHNNATKMIKSLEDAKKRQQDRAQRQLAGLDEMVFKGMENKDKFNNALMDTRFTELEALARIELLEVQNVVRKELKPAFDKREQAIRDVYKLPIFNLRAKLSIVKLKVEEKEKLLDELDVLEQEQANRLNILEQEKMKIVRARTKDQEASIKKRLDENAMGIYKQMMAGSNEQSADMNKKVDKLAEELQKTLFNLQQEIDNQKSKQDLIYQKMYQDLESAAAKIANEKGYAIVMRDVKVNLTAQDITEEIKAELTKYSNK